MENFDTASLRYKADVVFVSPNWNVVDPKSSKSFNLNTGLPYPMYVFLQYFFSPYSNKYL